MHKYSLFSIIKERHLYSRKNFCGTPENREKRESLAQQIFPRLWYISNNEYKNNLSDCYNNKWIPQVNVTSFTIY